MMRGSTAIAACLDALGDESMVVEGVVARRDNSRIHRASGGGRTIAIKECFAPSTRTPDGEAARREYDALMAVSSSIADDARLRANVPLPLALDREHGVYAMTWVGGSTATQLLLSPITTRSDAMALGELTGRWLRRFHGLHVLPPRNPDYVSRLDFVGRLATSAGMRAPIVRRAARVLSERATSAASQPLPASWVHGDMKSDNLLVDGDRVTGLDVQLVDENSVAYDIAPFLNHLRLLRWAPRAIGQGRKLDSMSEGFLRAYSPSAAHWRLPLAWLRVYLLIQRYASIVESRSIRASVAGWPVRAELAIAIDELVQCP